MPAASGLLQLRIPSRLVVGENALSQNVGEAVQNINSEARIFFINRRNSRERKIGQDIIDMLPDTVATVKYDISLLSPLTETAVLKASQKARYERCNMVLAVGGEMEFNFAKLVAFHLKNPVALMSVDEFDTYRTAPLLMVPTEPAVHVCLQPQAWFFDQHDRFLTVDNSCFQPHTVIIDPNLTTHLPQNYTATTGFTLLGLVLELGTSIYQNEWSAVFRREGIRLLGEEMSNTVLSPGRIESRRSVMMASVFLGMALNQSMRGPLFAVSRTIAHMSKRYAGEVGAMLLPHFMNAYTRYADCYSLLMNIASAFKENVGEGTPVEGAILATQMVERLIKQYKMQTKLSNIGVKEPLLRRAINNCVDFPGIQRSQNVFDKSTLLQIIQDAY